MNRYIICKCNNLISYQTTLAKPKRCERCGEPLLGVEMSEDDPRVISILKGLEEKETIEKKSEKSEITPENAEKNETINSSFKAVKKYRLRSLKGNIVIRLPEEGGVVGRTALGAEELADNDKVSREHIRVSMVKRGNGVKIEDISSNGTFINGKEMIKHDEQFISVGTEVTLYDESFILEVDDE